MDVESEVMTVPQMEAMVTEASNRLEPAATAWESAQRSYDAMTERGRYSTGEGHAASFIEHLPALETQEDAVLHAAAVAELNARRVVTQLARLSRPMLTADEMAQASSRAAVLAIEAERAPFTALIPAIRRAIATEDRIDQFLYVALLSDRVRTPAPDGMPEEEDNRTQVSHLLGTIRETLRSREFDVLHARAKDTLVKAVETRARAGRRRTDAALERQYAERGFVRIPDEAA